MFMTVLTGMPVPMTVAMKSGGGNAGWQEEEAGPTAEVISAIRDFGSRLDLELFTEAMTEELVQAVAEAFDSDDRRILDYLSEIVIALDAGEPARRIVARLLEQSTYARRRPAASRATPSMTTRDTAKTAGGDGAYRERFVASSKLQREFGSADTYVAYCRASHAGQVGICDATRKALASRAAP